MFLRILTVGVCLLMGTSTARADLDPETKTPYQLQIVLHFVPNKNMTQVFRTKVEQDVRDSLQAALGDLARVEIVDKHPLLKDVIERGLQYALDSWKTIDGKKTHFVLIDFAQGQYGISARQYDGTTGLASPVVRQMQTGDRLLVAREAALLVYADFGLVGTIVGDVGAAKLQVAIKGGALNAPLEHWIKKDDLFAVAQVVGQNGPIQRSFRLEWTALQVVELPKDGICVCKPLSRYKWPPPTVAGSQGFRCLKLGTTEGQLKMRLLGDDKQATPLTLSVWVGAQGFEGQMEKSSTDQNGYLQTREVYKNLAYVLIDDGTGEGKKKIPVVIVDDRTIVCVIKQQHGGELLGQLAIRRGSLLRRLDEDRISVELLWNELQKEGSMTPKQWLDRAHAGNRLLQTELSALTTEYGELKKEQAALAKDPKIAKGDLSDLTAADQMIKGLEVRREKLDESIKTMDALVKSGQPEKEAKWKADVEKAQSMEVQANYAEALATYERILAEGSTDLGGGVKKRIAELKELWTPKNQQHAQARAFIYDEWPQCNTARKMQEKMVEAKTAFTICKKADDYLTARKLFFVNQDQEGRLRKELDELKGNADNEDVKSLLELLKKLAPDLETFTIEVNDFLRAKAKAVGK